MARPNPDAKLRILVCDPGNKILPDLPIILHSRFGKGEPPSILRTRVMHGFERFEMSGVEYIIVNDVDDVVKEVKQRLAPYYSLVIYESGYYESEHKKGEGVIGKIADISKHDFFMPQMIIGASLKMGLAAQCARAGVLYFAEDYKEVRAQLNNIFQKPRKIPNLTVVKIGGSAFDFDRQVKSKLNLEHVCETLVKIHQDREGSRKKRRVNRIILTVGAGQYGDIPKDWLQKYGHNEKVRVQYPKSMAQALQANLENLKPLVGDLAALLKTGAFYYLTKNSASRRIPLIGTAPHYIMAKDGIPLQDSDTHTIALAEFCGTERVVLIKRTDGIYDFDPYRGFRLEPSTGRCASYGDWKFAQEGNNRYEVVSIDEMLSGETFSREGTGIDGKADGSTGHLMEDSALEYMKRCQRVREIVVVHIAPEEMYYERDGRYRHVVTGETLPLDTDWNLFLEQRIRDAFQGKAYSKIVKEK